MKNKIKINDVTFNIGNDKYSNGWYKEKFADSVWEEYTFRIIDYFSGKKNIYLDVGSWIGPTAIYSSYKYDRVYAFEPDPVAIDRLRLNLKANKDIKNIIIVPKLLSNKNGKSFLGKRGSFGNSLSREVDVSERDLENISDYKAVGSITIKQFFNAFRVPASRVSLIKVDIEGGEKYLAKSLSKFLNQNKSHNISLYISIHWNCLSELEVDKILNELFLVYKYCHNMDSELIDKNNILSQRISNLLFSNEEHNFGRRA